MSKSPKKVRQVFLKKLGRPTYHTTWLITTHVLRTLGTREYLPLDVVCSVVEELAKKLMTSYLCLQVVKKEACMYTWLRAVVRYLLVLLHSLVETPHPLAHTKTTFFGLEWMQNIFFSSPPPTRRSRRRRRWNQHRKWLPRTKTHLIRRDRQFKEVFFLRAFLYRFYTNSNRSGVFVWL